MKKLSLFGLILVACVCVFTVSCGDSADSANVYFSREKVADMMAANHEERVAIWDKVSKENQYLIWVDKINQVLSQPIKSEWVPYFKELKEKFTLNDYIIASRDLEKSAFLSDWIDRFQMVASEEERFATVGSLYDYNSITNDDIERKTSESPESVKKEFENKGLKISPRAQPGTGHKCDCRWTHCGSDEYKCSDHAYSDCSETTGGCGFLLMQDCHAFCVSCYQYDCDNY